MPDVSTTVTLPVLNPSVANIIVRWVKNGLVLTKTHAITPSVLVYTFSYLTDAGLTGVLSGGDIVSVSAYTVDANNLNSVSVPCVPAFVTVPTVAPPAPTSVTITIV